MGSLGSQIQSVTMGWQVYDISRRTLGVEQSAFNVSLIGLITFGPLIVLALPAGESADRYDRRLVLLMCYAGETTAVAALAWIALNHMATPPLLFALAFLFGTSRAFFGPAMTALAPMMVSRDLLPRAIVWNSLAGQSASVAGPAIAGLLIAISPGAAYLATAVLYLGAAAALISIGGNTKPQVQPGSRLALVREGLAYVWAKQGGPGRDLARPGGRDPRGRHRPAAGVRQGRAPCRRPGFRHPAGRAGAGRFGGRPLSRQPSDPLEGGKEDAPCRCIYGAATVVFGLSKSLWLSVTALAVLGGADMLSVFVRQTLVQLVTPDPMRGRVGAVSGVFIGASNELGEFESGVAARFLGPVERRCSAASAH